MPLIGLIDKKRKECFFINLKHCKTLQIPIMINLVRTYLSVNYPYKYKVEVLEKDNKKLNGYYTEFLRNYRTEEIIDTTLKYIRGERL